jgi:hypothetical protein
MFIEGFQLNEIPVAHSVKRRSICGSPEETSTMLTREMEEILPLQRSMGVGAPG